jgi:hypothetical protein
LVYWLCVPMVQPSITLASLAWCPGSRIANCKKRLSRILRRTYSGIKRATRPTSTGDLEALICLTPLDLVVLSEARSAAYLLLSLVD